jgi:hypothetical protein
MHIMNKETIEQDFFKYPRIFRFIGRAAIHIPIRQESTLKDKLWTQVGTWPLWVNLAPLGELGPFG